MQKIIQVEVNKLSPDKNQPRNYKDEDKINALAVSIKKKGVINPIEIDKDYVIITGEMRWRASRKAGLKTVPCKIISVTPKERFIRQIHENIHNDTMSAWDTAKALDKYYKIKFPKDKEINYAKLSREFGISDTKVKNCLYVLKDSPKLQRLYRKHNVSYTRARMVHFTQSGKVDWFNKIAVDSNVQRDTINKISKYVNRAFDNQDMDSFNKMKQVDWRNKNVVEASKILSAIMPDPLDNLTDVAKEIQNTAIKLVSLMEKYPISLFQGTDSILIRPFLEQVIKKLASYENDTTLRLESEDIKKLHGTDKN